MQDTIQGVHNSYTVPQMSWQTFTLLDLVIPSTEDDRILELKWCFCTG